MEQRRAPPIGIDLGTAYTRAAVIDSTHCRMIPDEHGNSAMASYVAFTSDGLLIGEAARAQAAHNPANTIFDVILLIGKCYSDPSVQNNMRLWPFKVTAGPDDRLQVEVNWNGRMQQFNPVEICSMLLMQIKENAEKYLKTAIADAVITVPVHFNFRQRLAIKQAGMIVGFNFMQIISAPAASGFFYGLQRPSKSTNIISQFSRYAFPSGIEEHNMVIFDLGAGTLDVAIVTIKENVCRVRATAGEVHLAGSDFDNNLVNYFVGELKKRGREDISNIPIAISNLRTLCEKAKISLSSGDIMVPLRMTPLYNDVPFDSTITEAKFNELNNDLFTKCMHIMERCVVDAKMNVDVVHEVILSGSSTRIPLLRNYIQSFFESTVLTLSQHLEAATAYGAAYQAFILSRRGNGRTHSLSLLDAIPFSLGLRSVQGTMHVFIPRNMNIPVRKENTIRSNRRPYVVEIYEGEGTLINANNFVGKFELPIPHNNPSWRNINVSFEIHENGTLTVIAGEPYGKRKIGTFNHDIEDSLNRVQEVLLYKDNGKVVNKASTSKDLNRSCNCCNLDKAKDSKTLGMFISTEKENSSKIISRQYIEPKEYAIGIDFGTSYSSVAVWQRNGVKIIENEYGNRLMCSVVAFTDTGRLIGDIAYKEQVTTNPASTIPNIKRLIGRYYSDQLVKNNNKLQPFKILCNKKNRPMVSAQYKNREELFAPEEIAAMILSKMREMAEAHLNCRVKKAIISVPAIFSDCQRKAIKDAGAIAGLDVMQLLNESTAAAIAYFSQKKGAESSKEKILLIFDLGGGNLDVSIIAIKEGSIRVQAAAGDANLGGEDFDNNMVSHFVEKFKKEKKKDISNKPRSLRRLRAACEKAKRVLSTNAQTMLEIDALDEGIDFHSVVTRKTFEEINTGVFKRCIRCVERCLEDARMDRSCMDEVVLIGGSTRIPKMQQVLQDFFNGKELCKSMNADEAVVYGAAIQAAILCGNEDREKFNILELQDVTSLSFGLENKDGTTTNLLIPKLTPIPVTKELIITNRTDGLSSFSIDVEECELASTMSFTLSGITPKPSVQSKINVYFQVDGSGILNLTAKDTSAREKYKIEIKENRGLTTEDIKKMVEAAARYKAEDEEHKKRAAAMNSLENFAYKLKAIAREAGLPASDQKLVEEAAHEAITWLETNHNAALDKILARQKKLETIDHKLRSTAVNSLANTAREMKTIAREAELPASDRKMVEDAADNAHAWLQTNQMAKIEEISAWEKQLETIKIQVRSDGMNYLWNLANEMKAIPMDDGAFAPSKKSVEAADDAIAWLQMNRHTAGIDEISTWRKKLETIKIELRSDARNSLEVMAEEIKAIARDIVVSGASRKSVEAADNAIAWLKTTQNVRTDEIYAWIRKLENIRIQLRSDAINYIGGMAYEMKEDPRYSEAAEKTIEWLARAHLAQFNEIKTMKNYLENTKNQVTMMET